MSKMASHCSFGHLQPKLWAKEGPGVKLAVWLPTTKSRESTSSRPPNWECDMALKRSRQGLQLWFKPRCNQTLQSGVMSSQSLGTPTGTISGQFRDSNRDSFGTISGLQLGQFWDNFGTPTGTVSRQFRDSNQDSFGTISGLQLGSPGKKSHLDVASAERCREYYMGEGGDFPRVWAVGSLVVRSARGLSQHPRVSRNVN